MFLKKLTTNYIDSTELLSKININIHNKNLHTYTLFHQSFARTNYFNNSPIHHMVKVHNLYGSELDIFRTSNAFMLSKPILKNFMSRYRT